MDIDKIINASIDAGKYNDIGNGIMLTNREIDVLEKYKINYKNCSSLKEIIFNIEDIISNLDIVPDELDYVSSTIAERDYYQNTNK